MVFRNNRYVLQTLQLRVRSQTGQGSFLRRSKGVNGLGFRVAGGFVVEVWGLEFRVWVQGFAAFYHKVPCSGFYKDTFTNSA